MANEAKPHVPPTLPKKARPGHIIMHPNAQDLQKQIAKGYTTDHPAFAQGIVVAKARIARLKAKLARDERE